MNWMRVAYFCDTFAPQINGVSMTLQRLGRYAHENGIETVFLVPDYPGTPKRENNVYRFFSIPLVFYKDCRIAIPPIFKAERILDGFCPDIIHAYSEFGISLAAIRYAKKKRIPIVSSYTSNFNTYLRYYNMDILNPCLDNYLNWFHNNCKLTFCPSESAKSYLQKKDINRVDIMKRGVDPGRFNPSFYSEAFRKKVGAGQDAMIFTYVGRISPEKDLDILTEVIRRVKARYGEKAVFVIVGDGPYLEQMKHDLGDKAVFTGFFKGEQLSAAYASSDLFVFPSTTETFGNVVLEAMCSGVPAIVPQSGGVAEIVEDCRNGYLVPPRDAAAFVEIIGRILENPQALTALRTGALETARLRTWDNVFKGLFLRYNELLEDVHKHNDIHIGIKETIGKECLYS
jgi:Glycosyltransferase